jgi:polyisoprenoid-binding protein YceI
MADTAIAARTRLPTGTWQVDPAHSRIGFVAKHLGIATVRGFFREFEGTETDPWDNERIALEVTGRLDRSDWGMTFNQVLGSGNMPVSDRVKLQLDISAVRQG